jgi:glycosyltransferase involved in cell wall biosynthesis
MRIGCIVPRASVFAGTVAPDRTMVERGALFVLPTTTSGQLGPVAAWTSTAGWAAAAQRVLGRAWIVTPSGEVDPEAARRGGSAPQLASASAPGYRRLVPTVAKTAVKDARAYLRSRAFRLDPDRYRDRDLAFVWQRHELFQTAGIDLARALEVPSALFVPATHVWEAREWGVRRPGWHALAERYGERPSLRHADVVACGTEVVAEQARRLGARPGSIIVTPTGVDVDAFASLPEAGTVRRRLGLVDRFVVGWVGSFRPFHALGQAIDALRGLPDAALLLVGDGPERVRIEAQAAGKGVTAVFTGTVPHPELPELLAAMDVALVLANRGETFHYSPLKLAEYLAAGRAVIAPRVPQLEQRLQAGVDSILVPPGDVDALTDALRVLQNDPDQRMRLGRAARASARARWSWDRAIRQILEHPDVR